MLRIEQQKSRVNNLCWLLKTHPKWWIIYDSVIITIALTMVNSYYAKYISSHLLLAEIFCFPIFFLIAGSIVGLYERAIFTGLAKLLLAVFATVILALLSLVALANIFLYEQIGRYVLVFIFGATMLGCSVPRLCFGLYLQYLGLRILFVGDKRQALDFTGYFKSNFGYYTFIGYCDNSLNSHSLKLGHVNDIDKIYREKKIDLVIIDDNYLSQPSIFEKCLSVLKLQGTIIDKKTFIEQSFEQVAVDELDPIWFYRANLGVLNNFQWVLKRLVDIFFAIIGLFFTALFYPFVWLAIKLSSPGPILYSQTRCGRFDKEFKIYKFRTMQMNAEVNGAVWAKENDKRVTTIGSILRKTRLDELPQFWNILLGDMSLVGPRPERPEMIKKIEQLIPYFYFRHFVKPGITGFAQVKYRYGASIEDAKEKLKYDLYYVKNWSFFMDIQIILRTIVMAMKGAR